jgi:nicotinamidase-related amidase
MNDTALFRSPELIDRLRSRLLVIDVQHKLVPTIHRGEDIVRRITFLLNAAQHMEVPVIVSEQYPQGLGPTVSQLADHPAIEVTFDKVRFSAADRFCEHIGINSDTAADAHDGRDQVILVGIESHVCVLQTAFDLMARGFRVFVADDTTGSGNQIDHETSMQRLRNAGATICTAESAAFEWCETAEAECFKAISKLVRDLRA